MEAAKNIIAQFINKNPVEITDDTVIDKTVVKGSILIHRMYAALSEEGYLVPDYLNIRTYGNLCDKLNQKTSANVPTNINRSDVLLETDNSIGVDIEKLVNIPEAADFREEQFYIQNFTPKEISYCTLKAYPRQSFLGLFCAKEALCKISASIAQKKFNEIEILHTEDGKPVYEGYLLSISHTDDTAVAIAMKNSKPEKNITLEIEKNEKIDLPVSPPKGSKLLLSLVLFSILISITTLLLYFLRFKN